ncbi:ABC transporter permease [Quadrisphaera sp. DSM 44207]|uniref:ABC transporter permease n=1 Tax=Quadrisphaera sp. DSM 44207 TaxID=1881057 RepID=UPI00088F1A26|nr:ABC transporter permease [Quadrisphaera sp. DSM 44207]SDQ36625.1 ABC-2 type transport system permease protein [Quadrisphaera sp. DSM 44207]
MPEAGTGPVALRDLRLLRSELRLVLTRRRNLVMLAVLALATTLIGIAIEVSSADAEPGEGPPFLASITENGIFLAFTALVASLPVFLPLAVSVVAGESVAGEASTGTLRYLLVTPVDRTRLLVVKLLAIVVFGLVAALVVAATGVVVGALLFPVGPVPLLSGVTVPYATGLLRVAAVALYVAAMLATVAALGLFVSTLTEVPVAAMSATAITVVLAEILDAVPQLEPIHPWLFTHDWLAFGDLLRDPVRWDGVLHGLAVQGGWIAVLLALAWARLTSRDVTS